MEKFDIFISYRRANNGEEKAGLLKQRLENLGYNVFYDFESLQKGNYIDDIQEAVKSCTDFIMLMTDGYLDRCHDISDPVAMEIRTAIKENKNIIPINYSNEFDYSKWPNNLPEDIDLLKQNNSYIFQTGQFYEKSLQGLIEWLDSSISIQGKNILSFREYLKSTPGKNCVKDFEILQDFDADIDDVVDIYFTYAPQYELNSGSNYEETFKEWLLSWFNVLNDEEQLRDFEEAINFYYIVLRIYTEQYENQEWDEIPQSNFKMILQKIPFLSKALYRFAPEYYIPYLFDFRMQELIHKAELFGFDIPVDPKRSDYKFKCEYYIILCKCLYDYRIQHNLTPAELCALLYDYETPSLDVLECEDIPEPTNAWFIGGKSEEIEKAASYRVWQANSETCIGDILVHYETTPISAITSSL